MAGTAFFVKDRKQMTNLDKRNAYQHRNVTVSMFFIKI
ncbi:hypothetical protein M2419_002166 [Sphingobacterium sp. BIGb0116]|nr:hypothetical protein [Sphingobacterium sp. BIGb0116]